MSYTDEIQRARVKLLEAVGYTGFVRLRPGKMQKCFACQHETAPLYELQAFRSINGIVSDHWSYAIAAERLDPIGHYCGPNHVTFEHALPDITELEMLFRISDTWAQARGLHWEDVMQGKDSYACILRAPDAGIRATADNRYDARFSVFYRAVFKIDLPDGFFPYAFPAKAE